METASGAAALLSSIEGIPYVHPSGLYIYLFTLLHKKGEENVARPPIQKEWIKCCLPCRIVWDDRVWLDILVVMV